MQHQAKKLTELRANHVTVPLAVSPTPVNHNVASDFVLIVEQDTDEIIAHNIKTITEQLTKETRDKLKRTEAKKKQLDFTTID